MMEMQSLVMQEKKCKVYYVVRCLFRAFQAFQVVFRLCLVKRHSEVEVGCRTGVSLDAQPSNRNYYRESSIPIL